MTKETLVYANPGQEYDDWCQFLGEHPEDQTLTEAMLSLACDSILAADTPDIHEGVAADTGYPTVTCRNSSGARLTRTTLSAEPVIAGGSFGPPNMYHYNYHEGPKERFDLVWTDRPDDDFQAMLNGQDCDSFTALGAWSLVSSSFAPACRDLRPRAYRRLADVALPPGLQGLLRPAYAAIDRANVALARAAEPIT